MTTPEKRVLDNEMRKKLAKIGGLGFTENPEFIFTFPEFKKKDKETGEYIIEQKYWPVFTLEGMGGIESTKITSDMGYTEIDKESGNQRYISKSGQQKVKILTKGIKKWSNYFDSEGNEIVFRHNNGKVKSSCLELIPPVHTIHLTNAITERDTLSKEELEGLDY